MAFILSLLCIGLWGYVFYSLVAAHMVWPAMAYLLSFLLVAVIAQLTD